MPRFSVLASGSSGNAAFLEMAGFGLLIDVGIGPRLLGSRLASIGMSWRNVNAVLLTHVHGDHWKDRTLATLRTQGIPLYCHAAHAETLLEHGQAAEALRQTGLLRCFEANQPLCLPNGAICQPVPIPHDSEPTFAFRIDGKAGLFHDNWSLGYAADLGTAPRQLIELFRDVQLLALEFNHDEQMQKTSGRPSALIDRVLGDQGHLSNRQAAESLRSLLQQSNQANLRHLVQLHLSHQCNRPILAQKAARQVLDQHPHPVQVHTACQDRAIAFIEVESA